MHRVLSLVLLLLLWICQLDTSVAVTSNDRLVERNTGRRIQVRQAKHESGTLKLQDAQEIAFDASNDVAPIPSHVSNDSSSPSKTTSNKNAAFVRRSVDVPVSLEARTRTQTCPAQPLPSGRCTCANQKYCPGNPPSCVNLKNSHENCGHCGHRCSSVQTCDQGTCICQGLNLSACGRSCVNLRNNEENCGTCGHTCARGRTCVKGVCVRL